MVSSYQPPSQQREQERTAADKVVSPKRYIIPARARVRQKVKKLSEAAIALEQQKPEIENDRIVLLRRANFFVRTAYQPDKKGSQRSQTTTITATIPKVKLRQRERIAIFDTLSLPRVSPITPSKPRTSFMPASLEAAIITVGLLISMIAHAINMFNFPRYGPDEGTYMSSAWAILQGRLAPYPYGYSHPPLAWLQIAAWVQLTGGFFTFGDALNTGRVLMLFYALGCALLVYLIVKRLSDSRIAGLLAMLIFSLSPLGITYQRQILLDNIGIFWLLLSLYLLVASNSRLLTLVLSALSLGIAILSKEFFLLFTPVMIYAVWLHTSSFQRKFVLVVFTYIVIALASSFVLLAILKGELFPSSWHLLWDHNEHLSLIQTLLEQIGRGKSQSTLATSLNSWLHGDAALTIFSVVTLIFNLIVGWWNRKQLMVALLGVSFWALLLLRGGNVSPFYFIPLIALTAINVALAIHTTANWLSKRTRKELMYAILIFGVIAAIIPYDLAHAKDLFTQHPTTAQTDAMKWIRKHVPHNAFIVINSYLYMDLHEPGGLGVRDGAPYSYAHIYFNVATDPELYAKILQNNWDRIDYIVADPEMLNDINHGGAQFQMIKDALNHAELQAQFHADDQQFVLSIYQVQHQAQSPAPKAG
ncbi:MAG TPA: phospholipid carrier-dependent glycosyltransferase [Ktedonosporobacter sp.]|nr:phospholipid carrier-dependent glycosyltransferase [Ktedonosporobacter sp.]